MLALTVIVISIIVRKFEEQLEKIRQEGSKVYKADVGRLSASAAAFSLGISNMRKRKGRTILTCCTLVILTFTVISFTSVRTFMHPNRTSLPQVTPRYTGLLIRDQYWRPLEEPVLTSVLNDMQKTQITLTALERLLGRKNEILVKQGQQPINISEEIATLEQGGFIEKVDEEFRRHRSEFCRTTRMVPILRVPETNPLFNSHAQRIPRIHRLQPTRLRVKH